MRHATALAQRQQDMRDRHRFIRPGRNASGKFWSLTTEQTVRVDLRDLMEPLIFVEGAGDELITRFHLREDLCKSSLGHVGSPCVFCGFDSAQRQDGGAQ